MTTADRDRIDRGWTLEGGIWLPPLAHGIPLADWMVWGRLYNYADDPEFSGLTRQEDYPGKAACLKRLMSCLFDHEECDQPFQWNPIAERIIDTYLGHQFTGLAGHVSSGKSRCVAALAVAEFIADPKNTGWLLTSTTIEDSKLRIWGDVCRMWRYAAAKHGQFFSGLYGHAVDGYDFIPGRLMSDGLIRYQLNGERMDDRGIKLIPGGKDVKDDGIRRMKGFKAPKLRLGADELSDLSHDIPRAAEASLFVVTGFRMIAPLNPGDKNDPGGVFCCPKDGWESVDIINSDGWETRRGYCLRFDGAKCPNVLAGREIYKGLLTAEVFASQRKNLSENDFLRNYRAIWPSGGRAESIYTQPEIVECGGTRKAKFVEIITAASGTDPAFSHGGDKAPTVTLWLGKEKAADGHLHTVCEYGGTTFLDDDIDPREDKKKQIVDRLSLFHSTFKDRQGNIAPLDPYCSGIDATAAGDVIASWFAAEHEGGKRMHIVKFNGVPSDKISSLSDPRPGHERYIDKRAELWCQLKDFLKSGQVRNLPDSIITQLKSANYETKARKIKVEDKRSIKKRLGFSPDEAESLLIAFDVLVQRFGFTAELKPVEEAPRSQSTELFQDLKPVSSGSFRARASKFLKVMNTLNQGR